jgi:hypothetical protein
VLEHDLKIPLPPSSPRCSLWREYPFEGLDDKCKMNDEK